MGKVITRKIAAKTELSSHDMVQQTCTEYLQEQGTIGHEGETEIQFFMTVSMRLNSINTRRKFK